MHQDRCAMKVTTDACLFGAWAADNAKAAQQVLDIGTGTGLLSLMMAQQHEHASIDAIEIDDAAYYQAKENVAASPWNQWINVIHADGKQYAFSKRYDVIISNPPFYENELKSPDSQKNKALHDEGLQLDDLLSIIRQNLAATGRFYILLPYKRNEEIDALMTKNKLTVLHTTRVRQSTRHGYFRIMLCGTLATAAEEHSITTEIAIKNEKQDYTPAFIQLLKDYYLYL